MHDPDPAICPGHLRVARTEADDLLVERDHFVTRTGEKLAIRNVDPADAGLPLIPGTGVIWKICPQ
jgi:hypothetical protein